MLTINCWQVVGQATKLTVGHLDAQPLQYLQAWFPNELLPQQFLPLTRSRQPTISNKIAIIVKISVKF